MGFFDKLKQGLTKTKAGLESVFSFSEIDDDFYDELEETLILADLGVDASMDITEQLRQSVKEKRLKTTESVREELRSILRERLEVSDLEMNLEKTPAVILMIGVNGVGKTTTSGKLAALLKSQGKKVILCAADTFRAAASDQLKIWADRAGVDLIRQTEGADPAAVVYDAVNAARARKADVVVIDTAGRLHNKQNLMNELSKISRVIDRELPDASRETLLVLDATTGQNGLLQAEQFKNSAGLTGVILTKLDGTAKGGIAIAIVSKTGVPVKYIGVGEQIDDLIPFDPDDFVRAVI